VALLSLRRAVAAGACAAIGLAAAVPAAAQATLEYEVKAAFLYNFIKFTEWPRSAVRTGEPFRVCTFGDDPFGGMLENTIAGDEVDGRPIAVERVTPEAVPGRCQILFVPLSQASRAAIAIRAAGTGPVLTVGESPDFLRAGGIVNFVVEGGRVRFDISVDVAAARGIRISSKLLRVARSSGTPQRRED
jgi:hypothetical protein